MGLSAFALTDIMPYSVEETTNFGVGVIQVPSEFVLYSSPDKDAKVVSKISWDSAGFSSSDLSIAYKKAFVVAVPRKNIAYMSVLDEGDDSWFRVCVDKYSGKSAWMKLEEKDLYYTWREFYNGWGRRNGLYFLKGVPEEKKQLFSSCSDDSQKLEKFDYPKFIGLSAIRGNWGMVTIVDIGNENKIGWIQWRNKLGQFYLFPSVNKKD